MELEEVNIFNYDVEFRTFGPMKDIYYDALNKKRQCVRKLLLKTMS